MKKTITKEDFLNILIDKKVVKFDIRYSKSGVVRLYYNDYKTSYKAGGGGYDKVEHILENLWDDLSEEGYITSTIELYNFANNYIYEIEINKQ